MPVGEDSPLAASSCPQESSALPRHLLRVSTGSQGWGFSSKSGPVFIKDTSLNNSFVGLQLTVPSPVIILELVLKPSQTKNRQRCES